MDFNIAVDIEAPAERVWAIMADVERWPEWTPSVSRIERLDPGPLRVGSRARVCQPKLPPAVWEVVELVEGREFSWVTRSPGVRVLGSHLVEARGAGSRATLALRFSGLLGPLVARLTRGLTRRYLGLEAEGLRQRSVAG